MLKMAKHSIVSVLGCLTALLLVSGCSSPKVLEISTKPLQRPELTLPKVDVIVSRPVKWTLITPENYEEVFAKLKKSGRPVVLFGVTDTGYGNLGLNLSDIRALVEQQKSIIVAYEGYYKNAEDTITKANKDLEEDKANAKKLQEEDSGGLLDKVGIGSLFKTK
jgi:hypothetical protein